MEGRRLPGWVDPAIYDVGASLANSPEILTYMDTVGCDSDYDVNNPGKDAFASFAQGQGEGLLQRTSQETRSNQGVIRNNQEGI